MRSACRSILVTLAILSAFESPAQTAAIDSLWLVWSDTTRRSTERGHALSELFEADGNITSLMAVSRIMPFRTTDTLSRPYVLQLGLARAVEGEYHTTHGRYTEH